MIRSAGNKVKPIRLRRQDHLSHLNLYFVHPLKLKILPGIGVSVAPFGSTSDYSIVSYESIEKLSE